MEFGLALGGGGLRGAIHVGFLQVLLSNGIKPNIVAGTSAGAIVAGLYASGVHPKKIESLLLSQQKDLLSQKSLLQFTSGLLNGKKLESIFKKLTKKKKFTEISLPTAIVATNIQNGKPVIFTSQSLASISSQKDCIFITDATISEAIRASIAIPGIFQPKRIKNYSLVDGGLVSNVPADVLKKMGVKKVIAVNLGFAVDEKEPPKLVHDILLQTFDIMGERLSQNILNTYADLIIKPKTDKVTLWQFYKIPHLFNIGRKLAYDNLDKINYLLNS